MPSQLWKVNSFCRIVNAVAGKRQCNLMAIRCRFNHLENLFCAVNRLCCCPTGSCFQQCSRATLTITLEALHLTQRIKIISREISDFWKSKNDQSAATALERCQLLHAQALQTCKFMCQSTGIKCFEKTTSRF